MKGKDTFSSSELENLKILVKKYYQANNAVDQKKVRVKLRDIKFYVSDIGITNITPQIFEQLIKSGKIKVSGNLFSQPRPIVLKKIKIPINAIESEKESDNSLTEKLLQGTFKKAGSVDNLVPDHTGFYCIKLVNGSQLPERYQIHLKNRKNAIIYIGKAEGQTLKKRFLGQELRARGHGTFFRSIGAVLGFLPEKGSLLDAKNKNNYTFNPNDEKKIIAWINEHLEVNWVSYSGDFSIEKELIGDHCPLLNDTHNPKKLTQLKEDKAYCRAVAKC
jgi:hypothetical protein